MYTVCISWRIFYQHIEKSSWKSIKTMDPLLCLKLLLRGYRISAKKSRMCLCEEIQNGCKIFLNWSLSFTLLSCHVGVVCRNLLCKAVDFQMFHLPSKTLVMALKKEKKSVYVCVSGHESSLNKLKLFQSFSIGNIITDVTVSIRRYELANEL